MYRYKLIESLLYKKVYCKDIVELIFKYMYSIGKKHYIHIHKQLRKELSYFIIEKFYLDDDYSNEKKTISRCLICNKIINCSSKFKFYCYLDCVDHLKKIHKHADTYNQTILNFITNQ